MTWASSRTRSVPYKLQQACFTRDNWQCRKCGYQGTPNTGDVQADHIHNRANGGQDTLTNLQTLCVPCHETKSRYERHGQWVKVKRRPRRHPADGNT